ncbi:hypothetical protein OSB04_020006 [Centaurea solstitialis]|uniref:CCHC-type domain-containing protein n=1 Tax=Centaurea solstitialis TaxID=347529 RepID=A0AA38TAX5_9ASTR|nr:hypothetical protein OSB04_020006 [Centaurea solstitialis]
MEDPSSKKKIEEKKDEKEKKKKKKVLVAESEESSEDEPSMKDLVKALALMTSEYRRGGDHREYRGTKRKGFREGGQKKEEVKDGCFNCGKPVHFAAECWSKAPKTSQKGPKDAAYFKRKAEYYTQKSLVAQTSDLVTDESFEDEAQRGLFAWEESDTDDEIFCGMAKVDEEVSNVVTSEVSTQSFTSSDLFKKISDSFDTFYLERNELKKKLSFYEKEIPLLTEEKSRFFKMFTEAQNKFVNLEKSSNEKLIKVEKKLEDKVYELRKVKHEMSNAVSIKEFFQKEREFLHQDILDRELKIRKFQGYLDVKIRVNIGRRGLGFLEFDSKPGFKTNKPMKDIFKSTNNLRSSITYYKSIFKKRRLMNVQKSSSPLVFTNVAFEDYIDSFSPSEKKNSIQRKFMSQSQMKIFRFGQPETQKNCAFVCFVRPLERKLSSDAPEFVPKLRPNYTSENIDLRGTTNSESLCREQSLTRSALFQNLDGPVLIDRD